MTNDAGALDPKGAGRLTRAAASEWVGPTAGDYDFHHMPGIYQTAFVKFANGYQADLDPLEMAWYLPSPVQDDLMLVRDFPPRLEPTPITPEPAECRG